MTLTELKYLVTLAQERHFGRAAAACHVSQPTLSVAIRKLEDELGVKVFERGAQDVGLTELGEQLVQQAQAVLSSAAHLLATAQSHKNPLSGALKLGVIHTIAPYVLPSLVKHCVAHLPHMPLVLHENYSAKLLEQLQDGSLDCALLAEPFSHAGLALAPLYDEPLVAVLPRSHALGPQPALSIQVLAQEPLLLLGQDHCFRKQVQGITAAALALGQKPSHAPALTSALPSAPLSASAHPENTPTHAAQSFNGTSLETLKHMVAAGMGVSVVPFLSVPKDLQAPLHALIAQQIQGLDIPQAARPSTLKTQRPRRTSVAKRPKVADDMLSYHVLLSPSPSLDGAGSSVVPTRRVVLAWRRSFTRYEAIAALRNAFHATKLPGLRYVA